MNTNRKRIRQLLAEKLRYNAGYHGDRKHWALEWNVSIGLVRPELVTKYLIEQHFQNELDAALQHPNLLERVRRELDSNYDDSHIIEQMRDGVDGGDTYRMWRPEIAARWGFEYKGKGAEKPFDVTFEFHGRQGKHLIVTNFEGFDLTIDLADMLERPQYAHDCPPSNLWCRQLCGMIEEWDLCFTHEAATNEYAYQRAFEIGSNLEDITAADDDECMELVA
jgi:hypothetical protein